ncbi:MFS transporter [Sphaerisporangium sp. TRM90804]|uniref:MFS transporter n=1 Tax=Sphaerisporangium sp. TRM90804 TaxID=3031113 RepID=UPI00244B06D0|nr:MFS transporter [Sphaerisporangium sp. TRM90804]MDH2430426.1 MFS transporter [Sphaerisporangium sp. TRM90804]
MSSTTSGGSRARLVRDRPTWLIYLQLSTFSTYLYGLSAALPLLRIDQGVSQAVAGLHGTVMAVGSVISGLAIPRLTSRFGRRGATWLGLFVMAAGTLCVAATTALPVTLLGFGLASGGGSITLYVGMSVLSDHHGPAGPAAINEANAVGVTVGIGVSYLVSVLAQTSLGWRSAILLTPVAALLLLALMGRVWVPSLAPPQDAPASPHVPPVPGPAAGPAARPAGTPFGWRFHAAGAVLFCLVAMEFLFNVWAAKLLADQTGMTAAAAATGLTAFTVGLAVGRFAGGGLALRFSPALLLTAGLVVTLAGWALLWLSTEPLLAYSGLAVSGLGVAVQFPLALSRLIAASGGRADQAGAAGSIWAGVAVGVGPFTLGALADGYGTHTAFLMVPLLITAAIVGIALSSGGRARLPRPAEG